VSGALAPTGSVPVSTTVVDTAGRTQWQLVPGHGMTRHGDGSLVILAV
jgi:hypothetical protein